MATLYPWFVFIHIVGVVLFAISHGASVYTAFRVRRERDPHTVASLLGTSQLAVGPMYIGLGLLLVGGLGAAAAGDLWSEPWIIASAVVLVVVIAVMYIVASPYYRQLRQAAGDPRSGAPPSATPDELARLLDTRRPDILVTVGGIGLVVLVWLMVLKPG